MRKIAAAGLDDGTATFLAALDANTASGLLSEQSGELAQLLGRPTLSLQEGSAASMECARLTVHTSAVALW